MIEHVISFLNMALQQDSDTVNKMFLDIEVLADDDVINHPTIQINSQGNLRLIGVLNGLVLNENDTLIVMVMDDDGEKIKRFEVSEKWW